MPGCYHNHDGTKTMAEPKAKSIAPTDQNFHTFLRRNLPDFRTPVMDGGRWRYAVKQQPIAGLCRNRLITYLQAADWQITARKPEDGEKYEEEIDHYNDLFGSRATKPIASNKQYPQLGFDTTFDLIWQDALDLPIGGNAEIVRYPPGKGPLKHPHPLGHVSKIIPIDGATFHPTGDPQFPYMQVVYQKRVFFTYNEIGRILMSPRPERDYFGYGEAPPERIYKAMLLLHYGDDYYAKLLLDTPEASILYLGDMDKQSAIEWLSGFRELFQGINPMKIPVVYETKTPPQVIPFNRDPSEMAYTDVTLRKEKVVCAGYGLKVSDIGLDEGSQTLAGKIRDDRNARSTGYGVIIAKTENFINRYILPPYLVFKVKIRDEESLIQTQRARLMFGQGAKIWLEIGLATVGEFQNIAMLEGIVPIELAPPAEEEVPPEIETTPDQPVLPAEVNAQAQMKNELARVPAEDGGRGDIPGVRTEKSYKMTLPLMAPEGNTSELEAKIRVWYEPDDSNPFALKSAVRQKAQTVLVLSQLTGLSYDTIDRVLRNGISDRKLTQAVSQIGSGLLFSDENIVLEAMYNQTQDQLQKAGIRKMILYSPSEDGDGTKALLSSWTINRSLIEDDMIKAVVPVGRILSTGKSGFGRLGAYEVVVIGQSEADRGVLIERAKVEVV